VKATHNPGSKRYEPVLQVVLEIPYDEDLDELLRHPETRSGDVSLEIGYAGWPAKIVDNRSRQGGNDARDTT
jgi:hypothetical protein